MGQYPKGLMIGSDSNDVTEQNQFLSFFTVNLVFLILYLVIFIIMLVMSIKGLLEPVNRTFTNILTIFFVSATFLRKTCFDLLLLVRILTFIEIIYQETKFKVHDHSMWGGAMGTLLFFEMPINFINIVFIVQFFQW
jgi:hypothetical protein